MKMFGQGSRTRTGPMRVSETRGALSPHIPDGRAGRTRTGMLHVPSVAGYHYPTARSDFSTKPAPSIVIFLGGVDFIAEIGHFWVNTGAVSIFVSSLDVFRH